MKKYVLYFLLNGIVFSLPLEAESTLTKVKDLSAKVYRKAKGAVEAFNQNHVIKTAYGYSMPIISGACVGVTWFMYGKYKGMKNQVTTLQASLSQIQNSAATNKRAPSSGRSLPRPPSASLGTNKRTSGQPTDVHLGGTSMADTKHPQVSLTSDEIQGAKNHLKNGDRNLPGEGEKPDRSALFQDITSGKTQLKKPQERKMKQLLKKDNESTQETLVGALSRSIEARRNRMNLDERGINESNGGW